MAPPAGADNRAARLRGGRRRRPVVLSQGAHARMDVAVGEGLARPHSGRSRGVRPRPPVCARGRGRRHAPGRRARVSSGAGVGSGQWRRRLITGAAARRPAARSSHCSDSSNPTVSDISTGRSRSTAFVEAQRSRPGPPLLFPPRREPGARKDARLSRSSDPFDARRASRRCSDASKAEAATGRSAEWTTGVDVCCGVDGLSRGPGTCGRSRQGAVTGPAGADPPKRFVRRLRPASPRRRPEHRPAVAHWGASAAWSAAARLRRGRQGATKPGLVAGPGRDRYSEQMTPWSGGQTDPGPA